jgi:hypothetical protein
MSSTATPTAIKTAVAAPKKLVEGAKEYIDKVIGFIIPIVVEFLRLLPDGLVFGVGLLSLLSFCKSYGVLLFTMFELMLLQRLFANFLGTIAPGTQGQNATAAVCQNGFAFPNFLRISMIDSVGKSSPFPASSMFFLVGIVTYIISATQQFKQEITTLGGDVNMRTNVATTLSVLFIFFMFIYRINYGCDSIGNIILTVIFALFAGVVIVYQNMALFGRDGINVLNIPLITSAADSGKPMYVCAPA